MANATHTPNQRRRAKKDCHKRRYEDEYAAAKALRKIKQKVGDSASRYPIRYYPHTCGGFHLTSEPWESK